MPLREHVVANVLSGGGHKGAPPCQSRHLDDRVVWDLCSRPAIVERMAALFGGDLILWRSNFFNKEPGDIAVPWHQDQNYWPLEPVINISAWLALDDVTTENSCVQIIPGSHKRVVPHVKSVGKVAFSEMADPDQTKVAKTLPIFLMFGFILVIIFLVFSYLIVRTTRRYRAGIFRKRAPPTDTKDVWSMHQLPKDDDYLP